MYLPLSVAKSAPSTITPLSSKRGALTFKRSEHTTPRGGGGGAAAAAAQPADPGNELRAVSPAPSSKPGGWRVLCVCLYLGAHELHE